MSELTQAREDNKLILATDVLRSGGTLRLHALGTSMLPCIWPRDVLTLQSAPEHTITSGDVILFVQRGRYFIHRVVGREQRGWITRGDSVPHNDPPVARDEVLGKVTKVQRNGRTLVPSRPGFGERVLGMLLGHSNLVRNLVLRLYRARLNRSTDPLAGEIRL